MRIIIEIDENQSGAQSAQSHSTSQGSVTAYSTPQSSSAESMMSGRGQDAGAAPSFGMSGSSMPLIPIPESAPVLPENATKLQVGDLFAGAAPGASQETQVLVENGGNE